MRLNFVGAVPSGNKAHQFSLKTFDNIRGQHAAAVEPFIDDERLPADLGIEVAVEIGVSAKGCVRHINIGRSSVGHPLDITPVVFDPGKIAQGGLTADRNDCHLSCSLEFRIGTNGENDLFSRLRFKVSVNIVCALDFLTIHG